MPLLIPGIESRTSLVLIEDSATEQFPSAVCFTLSPPFTVNGMKTVDGSHITAWRLSCLEMPSIKQIHLSPLLSASLRSSGHGKSSARFFAKSSYEQPLLFLPCSPMQAHELGLVVFLLAFFSSSFSSEEPGKLFFQCTEGSRSSKLKLLPKTETPTHSSRDRVPTAWEPSAQFITATAPLLRTSFLYRLFFLMLQQND